MFCPVPKDGFAEPKHVLKKRKVAGPFQASTSAMRTFAGSLTAKEKLVLAPKSPSKFPRGLSDC
jgi:hypothetical protein